MSSGVFEVASICVRVVRTECSDPADGRRLNGRSLERDGANRVGDGIRFLAGNGGLGGGSLGGGVGGLEEIEGESGVMAMKAVLK